MLRRSYLFLLIIIIINITSCRVSRKPVTAYSPDPDAPAYINRYSDLAISEMKRTGIPASITLAQGMIESDFGRSTLAREGNNHFGIKCHEDWTGPTIRHDDERRNECFRKYTRPEESFYDHSDFIKQGSRYRQLFDIPSTDYKGWAHGLKKAGYATNPDYANMLIRKIEENNLYYFDRGYTSKTEPAMTLPPEKRENSTSEKNNYVTQRPIDSGNIAISEHLPRVMENNRIQYIIVNEGETLEMIENEFQLLKWELPKYNELKNDFTPVPGQRLYLQPKRDKAEPGKDTHVVSIGDTMYSISQIYGVKLKKLYEYNRMNSGDEPAVGDKIWLRMMKPVN